MKWTCAVAGIALAFLVAPPLAQAQSVGEVENARAKDRQGSYLNRQERDHLRRYGSNSDYGPRYGYGYGGGYDTYYYPPYDYGYRYYGPYPY